jgi:hypothetical protein
MNHLFGDLGVKPNGRIRNAIVRYLKWVTQTHANAGRSAYPTPYLIAGTEGDLIKVDKSISTDASHSGSDNDLGAGVVFRLAPVRPKRRQLVFEPNRIADISVLAPLRRT